MNRGESKATPDQVFRVSKGFPWEIRPPRNHNRFDISNPDEPIFTLYMGESEEAAFAEVLAPLRPNLKLIALIDAIPCDSSNEPELGLISQEWLNVRSISCGELNSDIKIADITTPVAIQEIRKDPELAKKALECGFNEIDDSTLKSGELHGRKFTQHLAAHFFNQGNHAIRYGSRLGAIYTCIAGFIAVKYNFVQESGLVKKIVWNKEIKSSNVALRKVILNYGLKLN